MGKHFLNSLPFVKSKFYPNLWTFQNHEHFEKTLSTILNSWLFLKMHNYFLIRNVFQFINLWNSSCSKFTFFNSWYMKFYSTKPESGFINLQTAAARSPKRKWLCKNTYETSWPCTTTQLGLGPLVGSVRHSDFLALEAPIRISL